MEFSNTKAITIEEWEKIEKEEHDRVYKKIFNLPFDFDSYKIDKDHVLWWEDYCYKPGRRRDGGGHRTKKMLQHINLNDLHGKTILDIGCGIGQYSVLLSMFGAEVHGFDLSIVAVETAQRIALENNVQDKCIFSVQNASNIHYPDDTFDIIILHSVFHHAIKYPNVEKEIKRVLKKGGRCLLVESLDGNFVFKIARRFTMKGIEAKGDIVLTLSDIQNFANKFSESKIELMSLLFMSKRMLRSKLNIPFVRYLLYLAKKIDDLLLTLFPFLYKYCGECVAVMRK